MSKARRSWILTTLALAMTLAVAALPRPAAAQTPCSAPGAAPPPPAETVGPDGSPQPQPQPPPPPPGSLPECLVNPPDLASLATVTPPLVIDRFNTGRRLYVAGTIFGLIGSGLTLSSLVLTSIYGIGPGTGEIGPALSYAGSGATGLGVILGATGLGLEHSALKLVGADPGRGLYVGGTLLGILGLAGIGTSYFFGLTDYVPNSGTISFATSISAAVLLTVSGVLYFYDSRRMQRIYQRLTTF